MPATASVVNANATTARNQPKDNQNRANATARRRTTYRTFKAGSAVIAFSVDSMITLSGFIVLSSRLNPILNSLFLRRILKRVGGRIVLKPT